MLALLCMALRPKKEEKVVCYLSVDIPPMSPRSIRNVTSDKLDGAPDECLSVKENTLQMREKWSF